MKASKMIIWRSFLRGAFRGRRKEEAAKETYMNCFNTLERFIDTHKLGINLKERHVVLDVSLHRLYAMDQRGRATDRRYAAFFDKVVAYMNFQLGRMQKPEFIDPKKDTVTFHVTIEQRRYLDDGGNLLPAHRQVEFETIIVGVYRGGVVDYKGINN